MQCNNNHYYNNQYKIKDKDELDKNKNDLQIPLFQPTSNCYTN